MTTIDQLISVLGAEGRKHKGSRLRDAVANGHYDSFVSLLEAHPTLVHQREAYTGQPILNYAALYGQKEMVELLIHRGADVHARDHAHYGTGKTAFLAAAEEGETEVAQLLLQRGADINATAGAKMIHPQALGYGLREDDIKQLSHAGRNGAWNDHGWTALMHAAERNDAKLCAVLLMLGASATSRSRWGKTARDLTTDECIDKMLECVERAGGAEKQKEQFDVVLLKWLRASSQDFEPRLLYLLGCLDRASKVAGVKLDEEVKRHIIHFHLRSLLLA
jgi:ankyrin repeat protein